MDKLEDKAFHIFKTQEALNRKIHSQESLMYCMTMFEQSSYKAQFIQLNQVYKSEEELEAAQKGIDLSNKSILSLVGLFEESANCNEFITESQQFMRMKLELCMAKVEGQIKLLQEFSLKMDGADSS